LSQFNVYMKNFIVSARKYRPDTFESVVGQSTTTATLKNAISGGKLAQAYLFCGPRGVGKTTCARIFAKTINCTNITSGTEACNQCDSCKTFNENRSYNIHELDAASNNSVDDIRNLIEQVRIPPQVGKYSVYIIDEVHMLSQSAFNAFLKTLEEPPPHVVFILATTEKHKILPTILSRCQIYDFNRIKIQDIVGYLGKISEKEQVDYEPDALNIIAQKADGAMRDALSIYDQMVSFSEGKISYRNVIDNLNVLDYEYYFKMTDAMISGQISAALLLFDEILQNGFDGHNFINGLSHHFRQLLVSKYEDTRMLLETGENTRDKYIQQTRNCESQFLYDALEICNECDVNYRTSKNQRLHVEIALIRLCNLNEKKNISPDPESLILPSAEEITEEITPEPKEVTQTLEPEEPEKAEPVREEEDSGNNIEESAEIKKDTVEHKPSTLSIKEALSKMNDSETSGEEAENEYEDTDTDEYHEEEEFENQPVTEDLIVPAWMKYAEKLKKESPRIYSILKDQKIEVDGDGTIKVYFNNKTQIEDFKTRVRADILSFLRKELNNDTIELTELLEDNEENNQNNLYTAEDKFRHMAEKNPALNKLKQQFNLDFE
jgi:DNA polymerase III subunit gamma/tau